MITNSSNSNMKAYPVAGNMSYSCEAAAEIQLNVTDNLVSGLKIKPAQWEAFSEFGNRTHLSNPAECAFDHNDITPVGKTLLIINTNKIYY